MDYRKRTGCGKLRPADIGREVCLAGWVDARRDHGDLLFIHLRDISGIVQVVFNVQAGSLYEAAGRLKEEYCVLITGQVVRRLEGTENPALETGDIEIKAAGLEIISASKTPPFPISEKAMTAGASVKGTEGVEEDLRLQYRYLDLRRPSLQKHLVNRYRIIKAARDFLDSRGFIEVETPTLTRSTPEGARDYLVPSRLHPGNFYALPQSPQLFKQLLMVGGLERYFQVVRCYRDEDLRPNRQPEFTQLDLEASFLDEEFIYELMEEALVRMFAVAGISLPRPFPRISYREAMETTGTDRPDLRFDLRLVEATDLFRNTGYAIFRKIIGQGGRIKGLIVRGKSEILSKNVLQNEYAREIVPGFGAKGMTWMRVAGGKLESNIVQFFNPGEQQAILERFQAEDGSVIMMIADTSSETVLSALGQLRLHLARRLELIPGNKYHPVWVTGFPLFEATEAGLTSKHHPFTAPDRTDFDPADRPGLLSLNSRAYDLVVNGEELGGGSIRINDARVQRRIFQALDLSEAEVEEKFGFFVRALDYGTPPHGGLALGLDRVASMILGTASIRDVIAFPKNRSAVCPLTQAPAPVTPEQLAELHLAGEGELKISGRREEDPVKRLAWVSRLGYEESERNELKKAVEAAADLAGRIEKLPADAEPVYSPSRPGNRMRPGRTASKYPGVEKKDLFRNAPAVKNGHFKVANILE